jgi:lipoprotein-releasing system ATP-binding protein
MNASAHSAAVVPTAVDARAAGALLQAQGVQKSFRSGAAELRVLNGVDLAVERGEMIAVVGPSGSGKSTLLHMLAALDTPTNGAIYFDGKALHTLSEADRAAYRNHSIGFVWQRHHLLPDFTAAENVAMPLLVNGTAPSEANRTAGGWLEQVGLAGRAQHRAGELSGGEQQRVAIARALVASPRVLLADEPTGDLDEQNAEAIFALLQRLHATHGLTTVMATHNHSLALRCDRILGLQHGVLEAQQKQAPPATESSG